VSYFSGIVDEHDVVYPGGYPGALRELLGLTVEEFRPLRAGETVTLSNGATADVWTELIEPHGADTVLTYADGSPAVLRHEAGEGVAWYISTRLHGAGLGDVLRRACADAGVSPRDDLPEGLEVVRRGDYLIAINHTDTDAKLPATGQELLTATPVEGVLHVPAGDVRVITQS
jgi:beta-galactosidase